MDTEQRAIRAKQLLEDQVLTEVFTAISDGAISAWRSTKTADTLQREWAWMTVKILDRIRDQLQAVVDDHAITVSQIVRPPQ